jgi:peptidyl-tRNA hydrolase, PTH1 family
LPEAKRTKTTKRTSNIQLIVGLGNPGPAYSQTRHNAGFLVVDRLAARQGVSFKKSRLALEAKPDLTLIKPLTFMNLSGQAVQAYQTKLGLKPAEILVIHDDLDLPLGKLRLKAGGGGAGGQRGVRDIIARIGTDFVRLKVGIGRPPAGWRVENWVLSRFQEVELPLLERVIESAADACELVQQEGIDVAMNRFNRLNLADQQIERG